MTQVVLIRPGATVYDEQNRVQGVLDVPLSDRGRAEVALLAETLPEALQGVNLLALYCGPGESVVRTAEAVGRALGLRPKRLDDLRNLDQGLWQGLQIDDIKRRNLRVYRQWVDDPLTVCPPLGETVESAVDRVKSALKPLIKRHQDEDDPRPGRRRAAGPDRRLPPPPRLPGPARRRRSHRRLRTDRRWHRVWQKW